MHASQPSHHTNARRGLRALVRDTRGAAYTEVVLMMPVFISLFAGIGFFHDYYTARMNAATEARRCAWAYANGGCEDVPAGCGGIVGGSRSAAPSLSDAQTQQTVTQVQNNVGAMERRMPVPGVARRIYEMILGASTTATGSEPVTMPDWVGGGSREARCSYTVVCNEEDRDLVDVIHDAFCSAVGTGAPGRVLGCIEE